MQFSENRDVCLCPPIIPPPCPPSCQQHSPIQLGKDVCSKYYQEIGADMIGNQLIIRLEKDKSKSKKKQEEWDPPCDCVEIQRPTSKKGPKIINADSDDRIVFRVHSSSRFQKKEDPAYKSQTIAYKVESRRDEQDSHRCKTITVFPQLDSTKYQEVYSDHITGDSQDIFLLRIKKKAETSDQKNRNVELELRTPKAPTPPHVLPVVASKPVTELVDEKNIKKEEDIKKPEMMEKVPKAKKQPKKKKIRK